MPGPPPPLPYLEEDAAAAARWRLDVPPPPVVVDAPRLRASVLIGDRKPGGAAKPPPTLPAATVELELVVTLLTLMLVLMPLVLWAELVVLLAV